MKLFTRIMAGAVAAVSLLALISCTKSEPGHVGEELEGLIAIQPEYVGEEVTSTDHEFKKEDFKLTAVFTENHSEEVEDFAWEIKGMAQGVYLIDFYYYNADNELYVPVNMEFFE